MNPESLKNKITLADCMDIMAGMPDKCIDLAIVDPPYGIGEDGGDKKRNRNYSRIVIHEKKEWDNKKPDESYFNELKRISKNQIIFGANYFVNHLDCTMGWIFWDKKLGGDFSDGELIYTSFDKALKMYSVSNFHGLQGGHLRIHPTQKPVVLYRWILQNYAKPGQLILDTHSGSGSCAIACHLEKYDFIAIEKDPDYHAASVKRLDEVRAQGVLF